jgi:hypothetical protein
MRILIMSAWSMMHTPGGGIVLGAPPIALIGAVQAHVLAFHAPSMWSTRVHRQTCLELTEYIMYYGLLQSVAVECMSQMQTGAAGLTACYCGMYYAWDVSRQILNKQAGTLAPYTILLSLVLYCVVTIPYLNGGIPGGASAGDHLLAWIVADTCYYVMRGYMMYSRY